MSLASMCRSSVYMQRQNVPQDSSGGQGPRTWADVGALPIRCDIQPASGSVQMRFMQEQLICTHTIYLVSDPGATADCRFQTADRLRTFVFRGRQPAGAGYKEWPCVIHVEEIL